MAKKIVQKKTAKTNTSKVVSVKKAVAQQKAKKPVKEVVLKKNVAP